MKNIVLYITTTLTIISMIANVVCLPLLGMQTISTDISASMSTDDDYMGDAYESDQNQNLLFSFMDVMEEVEEEEEEEEIDPDVHDFHSSSHLAQNIQHYHTPTPTIEACPSIGIDLYILLESFQI